MPRTVLVTGGNRGLGLEFVRQCSERGDRVLAACRHPDEADELQSLAGQGGREVSVLRLDVGEEASIIAAAKQASEQLGEQPLDVLINNAGIYGGESQAFPHIDADVAADVYRVNVIGPMLMFREFDALLADEARVVSISSGYGSIERSGGGWPVHYCCSKSALNMLSAIVGQAMAAETPGRCVVAMNPGWVQTDMGGANATLTPEQSIAGMLRTIEQLTPAHTGTFWSYEGERMPW